MAPFGLGAPAVEWYVEFDGGRPELVPGVGLRGIVRFASREQLQVNRLGGRIVGTEEYAYDETDYDEGSRTTNRQWGSKELLSQELTLLGPGWLVPGQAQAVPFAFAAPPNARAQLRKRHHPSALETYVLARCVRAGPAR